MEVKDRNNLLLPHTPPTPQASLILCVGKGSHSSWVTELSAYDAGLRQSPVVVADRTPLVVVVNLHPPGCRVPACQAHWVGVLRDRGALCPCVIGVSAAWGRAPVRLGALKDGGLRAHATKVGQPYLQRQEGCQHRYHDTQNNKTFRDLAKTSKRGRVISI